MSDAADLENPPEYSELRDEVLELRARLWEKEVVLRQAEARLAEAELDAALGRIAMRFVDRAGDYCEVDPAERICDEFHKAMAEELDKRLVGRFQRDAARAPVSADALHTEFKRERGEARSPVCPLPESGCNDSGSATSSASVGESS